MALQGQEGQGHCRDRRVTPRGSAGTAGSHPGALLQPPLDFPPEEAWQGSELLSDTFNSSAANAAASSLPQQGDFWGEVCGAADRKTSCDVRKAAWKKKKKILWFLWVGKWLETGCRGLLRHGHRGAEFLALPQQQSQSSSSASHPIPGLAMSLGQLLLDWGSLALRLSPSLGHLGTLAALKNSPGEGKKI